MDGFGKYIFTEGSYYSGMWKEGQMHGFGVNCYPKEKIYIGFYEKDERNGFGIINWFTEKKIYIGFWKNNKQDGHGIFIIHDNVRYGFWKNGKKNEKYENFGEFQIKFNEYEKKFINIMKMDYDMLIKYISKFIDDEINYIT